MMQQKLHVADDRSTELERRLREAERFRNETATARDERVAELENRYQESERARIATMKELGDAETVQRELRRNLESITSENISLSRKLKRTEEALSSKSEQWKLTKEEEDQATRRLEQQLKDQTDMRTDLERSLADMEKRCIELIAKQSDSEIEVRDLRHKVDTLEDANRILSQRFESARGTQLDRSRLEEHLALALSTSQDWQVHTERQDEEKHFRVIFSFHFTHTYTHYFSVKSFFL